MNYDLAQLHAALIDIDRIPVIVAAIILSAAIGMITGPLFGNANPLIWNAFSSSFGAIGDRLNKRSRTRRDLMTRGTIVCIFALIMAFFLGRILEALTLMFPLWGLSQILLLSLMMSTGAVWFALLRLYIAMEQQKIGEGAYYAIAVTARRNLTAGDDFGITRVAMGLSARSFDKALVAPALWYLIGGFPLCMLYCVLAAFSWRFGKDGFHSGFASTIQALEKIMGFVPSVFSGLIITLSVGVTPTASLVKALKSWFDDGVKAAHYQQGGAPLSAMAWALNLSLGGASQDISGSAIKADWIGPSGASAKVDHKHLRRAIYLNAIAHIIFIAALLGAYMWGNIL